VPTPATPIPKASSFLPAHELSLLLRAINRLRFIESKEKSKDDRTITAVYFPSGFTMLLNANVVHVCKNKNITLRNLANIFKALN
jgi:hypothetical protein